MGLNLSVINHNLNLNIQLAPSTPNSNGEQDDTQLSSEVYQLTPAAYEAKKRLNAEFFQKARIPGAVSFLYYPIQHGPAPHAELEVEGRCYSFRSGMGPCKIPTDKSYHKRIYKIRQNKNDGRPPPLGFVRFGITATPAQIANIQENIEDLRETVGLTCIHAVKRALKEYVDFSIPAPLGIGPTSTAAALYLSKNILGSKKISQIEPHMSHRPTHLIAMDTLFGVLPEMTVIAYTVGFLYVAALIYSKMSGNNI